MKRTLYVFAMATLFACNENKTTTTEQAAVEQVTTEAANTTAVQAKEGKGNITLVCGTQTLTIAGVCGAVTTTGTTTIAVKDDKTPSKVFTVNFYTDKLPEANTTYKMVKYTEENAAPANVYVGCSEVNQNTQMDWSSDDKSGTLDFVVNGNEIKCTFKDITLQPSAMYNKGDLNNPGKVSGEFTLYK